MRFALLLALIVSSLSPSSLGVCSEPQPRLVCAEYSASTLVVEAVLNRQSPVYDRHEPTVRNANIYTLHVIKVFRGEPAETIRIYVSNDSGRATFDWMPGRKYLLFLVRSPSSSFWELDGCGNSGPLTTAKKALSSLAAIDNHSAYGSISGAVSQWILSAPFPGVRVVASGNGESYSATTNKKGEFGMQVPVGSYVVKAFRRGFVFDAFELSYSGPQKVQIEPGGCVQIQLIARRNGQKLP